MAEFSPEFEEYVQSAERGENRPAPQNMPPVRPNPRPRNLPAKRQRIRKTVCVIPECTHEARRANKFPICTEHLLQIWKLIDGDPGLNGRGYHEDATGEKIEPVTITVEEQEAQRLAKRQKLRELAATKGWLYVLDTRDGLVKIGYTSRHLWDRIAQYPPTFRLITFNRGSRADERDLHRSLRLSRVKGREWYEVTPEVVRLINEWIAIENTKHAQRISRQREELIEHRAQGGLILPFERDKIDAKPQFKPKFVSLDEWVDLYGGLKATGTEPEGYYRA